MLHHITSITTNTATTTLLPSTASFLLAISKKHFHTEQRYIRDVGWNLLLLLEKLNLHFRKKVLLTLEDGTGDSPRSMACAHGFGGKNMYKKRPVGTAEIFRPHLHPKQKDFFFFTCSYFTLSSLLPSHLMLIIAYSFFLAR